MWPLGMLAIVSAGCHSRAYAPGTLPQQYASLPATPVGALDLSGLSTGQYNSRSIQPGDTLAMTIVSGAEEETPEPWPIVVNEDGTALVPLVGPIRLAGYDLPTAQAVVRDASVERGVFRQPAVAISVQGRDLNRVTVMGAVENPGTYELPVAGSDLLAALLAAGGLTDQADTWVEVRSSARRKTISDDRLQIARTSYAGPGDQGSDGDVVRIDLASASRRPPTPVQLRDGDVVHVREVPPRFVQVIGLVNKPNRFEIPPGDDLHVLDAIALAGGLKVSIADKVRVTRPAPDRPDGIVIEISLRDAKQDSTANLLLADGDVVTVEETPVTFVIGAIQSVVRVGVNGAISTF